MTHLEAITTVAVSAAMLFGMQLALLGSIKLALARRMNLSESGLGSLLLALQLALIPMMIVCGLLLDWLGIRLVLLLGSVLSCVALLIISLSPTYKRALGAVFLAGLGGAALSLGAVTLMPHAFFAPPEDMTASLHLGHVFIALGALLTPAVVDGLLRVMSFRRLMGLLCLLSLVPALLCVTPGYGDPISQINSARGARPFLDHPDLWILFLAGLVYFLYVPLEAALGIWSTAFLSDMGQSDERAGWMLSGFWGAFLASRIMFGYLRLSPFWDPWLIFAAALAAASLVGNLIGSVNLNAARFGVIGLGFVLGPIVPALVGVVFRDFPSGRGLAYSVLFAMGSAGSLILAPLFASQVQDANVRSALRIPFALSLVLTALALVFALVVGL
jgi:MFS family permease